jgi:hypothetical protein
MTRDDVIQTAIALILALLVVLILNPYDFWMPTMTHMALLGGAIVAFGLYAVFILREESHDEREEMHRMHAGRAAYLVGAGILTLGILYQSYTDTLDVWLVLSLVAMILGKIATRFYSDRRG